ncbi:MAG: ATP-dependent Clp protease ATP-binding subunit [Acidobacteria bacterium]|nr:ATP-dependent Clp protease ATP-binding subunit [Acidobacteriota bacterium]
MGQDESIDRLVCSYSRVLSGLRDPSRPLLTVLLLGPTGVGKTETARALTAALRGLERAFTRVNCQEYAQGHEISKLLGSPPGYAGGDIEPLLSQSRIDHPLPWPRDASGPDATKPRRTDEGASAPEPDRGPSIVLFDEIEKAHPTVWNALLGILEEGMLTLGNNSTTDFTRSIILMTSNVGGAEMGTLLHRRSVGFVTAAEPSRPKAPSIRETALAAARATFPLEFLNRFDEILVYSPLERVHLERIFDTILADIHGRALTQAGVPILIRVSPEAKSLIIDRGLDPRFGARPLRRAMEREIVDALSRLIASRRIKPGDVVEVHRVEDRVAFFRRQGTAGSLIG